MAHALEVTDTLDLADRVVDELSGGQRQRVWIAMALAQETDLLLLDEPTTYLDVAHQVEVLDLLRDLNASRGTTIVMVLHELNLAARYADHLIAMRDGVGQRRRRPGRRDHPRRRARGVRHGLPGHRRPGLAHPDGRAGGTALPLSPRPTPRQQRSLRMTTQATQTSTVPSALVAEVRVDAVERLSPAFVRVTFGGAGLRDLSTADGFDTRFKVVFPGPTGLLPQHSEVPEEWQAAWLGMPDEERSPMRTYTIREIRSSGDTVQLVADFVVHERRPDHGTAPATSGPPAGGPWPPSPGDVVHIVGPHRLSPIYGGTEFEPGELRDLLVIGDETALPAVARILADVDPGFTGHVFVEVPSSDDIVDLPRHDLIDVTWLVRGSAPQGRRLVSAVRGHLGLPQADLEAPLPELKSDLDVEVWETPRYSSAGEDLAADPSTAAAVARTGPRRHLRLDRRGVVAGQGAAPRPGVRARRRALPGRVHGLLARGRRHALLSPGTSPGVSRGRGQAGTWWPVPPSSSSRRMSAWPACRTVSSIMCTSTQRRLTVRPV